MATRFKNQFSISLAFTFFFFTLAFSFTEDEELGNLLRFKASIDDPKGSLSGWLNTSSSSSSHHCNWTGIICTRAPSLYVSSINLQSFNLSGEISDSICDLPYLTHLDLSQNFFNQPIPLHLSRCVTLETLNLSSNLIWGTIPDQISEFSSLKNLDLSSNHVEGKIPEDLGLLFNLQVLNLGSNLLTGVVPAAIGKLSELVVLDLSENSYLVSEIPSFIGKLDKLEQLLLHRSGFHGEIPTSFVGLTSLKTLDLCFNNLSGEIPRSLGTSLKNLVSLDVSQNKLSGSFPGGICSGKRLINLSLHSNFFEGSLPNSIGECLTLERFQVQDNGFSGEFPAALWKLPKIKIIKAYNNQFTGQVPDSVSLASALEQVEIDNNSFSGEIPHGLGLLKGLYKFSASENGFGGELPPNFCDSPVLSIVNISHNRFLGKIPELKNCKKLVSLSLAGNAFTGEIPPSLADLHVLTYLDLSENSLTGLIPQDLQNLKLALFNVSFNRLSGEVPQSLVSGLPASFLQGNPELCGHGLPNSCSSDRSSFHKKSSKALVLALICLALAIATLLAVLYRYSRKKVQFKGTWHSEFYYSLKLTEHELMKVVNETCPSGSEVYVLSLSSGELIAVKKLVNSKNVSSKALKAQVRTIAKIRHKNITRILGFCFTEELLFLIYEFTQHGSLHDMLSRPGDQLQWSIRLKIALGVAQALAYISKDYVPHLLHRNLKSANILLDKDFEPKLSDFALDHIVGETAFQSLVHANSNSCYTAPEINYSKKATEDMDVYSFGVVLLELVTGQRAEKAVEGASRESLDIVKQVRRKINLTDGAAQVLDQKILSDSCQSDMLKTLDLALDCTAIAAEKRPSLVQVIKLLEGISSSASASAEKFPVSA
ncbi:PREDICTED: probably inactive leucine-rich repeat receptor-like protein kinase At5g06940 [Camelina sativa]|uniref:non-specific serine/threonine protein kinase n=1 Tax=Camelina sativa TaxID=90675 RepID=A0ABM0XUQ1_CAMSA|nr:PREDICTED: probably inactive leucine-rich repeat receptor-like protein kinase At5g06940 [Camelina sativa]